MPNFGTYLFVLFLVMIKHISIPFRKDFNILEIQYLLGHTTLEATYKLAERFLRVDEGKIRETVKASGFTTKNGDMQ